MYQTIDNTLVITVNDWLNAGLTKNMFNNDSKRGYLDIYRRGVNGNTLIDVRSIKRPERLVVIEEVFGKLEEKAAKSIFVAELDVKARSFYTMASKPDGSPLTEEQVVKYTNKASLFSSLKKGLEKQRIAHAKAGKRMRMGEFWKLAMDWYNEHLAEFPCEAYSNVRSFERAFKKYLKCDYSSLINGNMGNDSARLVSAQMERLFIAIWRMNDKPFVKRVYELYLEFISGDIEFFDKKTGEIFSPEDIRHKCRDIEVSEATVWRYLKDVVNTTAVYADRNGNFDYTTKKRPKHHRKLGQYTLSKITMDDVALSRKSVRGWVFKYIAVDVVSGYWFRPAYVVGKPSQNTILESFRNMFCELDELGLPMPGELEVEHHLMKDLDYLNELFPFVRFCNSPTEKRAEHKIKEFKYGVSKKNGHTRGRWYAKSEAFRSVRNKVSGDYVEPEYQPQAIVLDDLADVEEHNNQLHPLQKTYPGMTRKEVFLANINPDLLPIEKRYLYRHIGNSTDTSIYNNDYCPVQMENFELMDFNALKRLKSNNYSVTAYWLPEDDGSIKNVYLYQDDTYIGEALNRSQFDYNENKIEQTDQDILNIEHQNKRVAKFDKFIKEHRSKIPTAGYYDKSEYNKMRDAEVKIVETEQPKGYEEDEFSEVENVDWAAAGANSI